ncbi:MAG: aspartate aminotransferase family protein [Candidatus Hydrogenedentes bacterium]|nr:aspartate aminotransferase family protein [Candidatus Hydrogenedentota bacterium]
MTTSEIKTLNEQHVINTYGSRSIAFVRGEGVTLWDAEGKEYLDFFAGIAVTGLGHCHPKVTEALCMQAKTLVHVSNLYYIEPQVKLAALLCQHSFADKWFFSNCGAGAMEAAMKLVRRYWSQQGTPKPEFVTMLNSFHGRTFGAISATGQPKYQEGFEPLLPGIKHVPFNDIASLRKAVSPQTGAVIVEPIQGEGGVRTPSDSYLKQVRELCNERGALLIFDEVQTGVGRTGKFFAHEHYGVTPDIIVVAKGLGNGVPIGAMGCTEKVASGFSVGSHASTFGGNPLCTAAALATVEVILEPGFLDGVVKIGEYFVNKLSALAKKHSGIVDVRGKGLLVGVEMKSPVAPVVQKMLDAGIVCGPAGPNVLRFAPPLIITQAHVDRVVATLDKAIGEV